VDCLCLEPYPATLLGTRATRLTCQVCERNGVGVSRDASEVDDEALADLGTYLRAQREIAQVSLRALARMTNVSDSYLSQVERGLYQPSPVILRAIADGLGLAPDELFRRLGWLPPAGVGGHHAGVIDAIGADAALSQDQKAALIQTYKAMVGRPIAHF
jgi:transcriptional regulator with XRE-family HTH domain